MSGGLRPLIERLGERARGELELFEQKCLDRRKTRWLVGDEPKRSRFASPSPASAELVWPAPLPFPLEARTALELVRTQLDAVVELAAEDIATWASRIVPPKLCNAVICRRILAEQWRWPASASSAAAMAMHCIGAAVASLPEVAERRLPPMGPSLVAPSDEDDDESAQRASNAELFEILHQDDFEPELSPTQGQRLNAFNLGLLYLAEREVRDGRHRPAVAIDATSHNHTLLTRWSRVGVVGNPNKDLKLGGTADRISLVRRGESVQLEFTFDANQPPSEAMLKALKRMLGPEGVRHWIAVQVQLTENGRQGWFYFDIDQHMQTMGLTERSRRDPERRRRYGDQVKIFTRLELAAQISGQWARSPLLVYGGEYGSIEHDEKGAAIEVLDGFKLSISPLIYSGVRDPETGKLGKNWMPAPVELARLDHHHFGPAMMLGQILLIRMRWDIQRDRSVDRLSLAGSSLLEVAGLEHDVHNPSRPWDRLERNLDKLKSIGLLDAYAWRDGAPWSNDAICDLWPADWILDRAARGVRAIEEQAIEVPATGAELREWRQKVGLSQLELAQRLGLNRKTIGRNETSEVLSPRFQEQLRELIRALPI